MSAVALDALELHALARDKTAEPPEAFAAALERLAEAELEHDRARRERDELIRVARAVGVSFPALERWSGLRQRQLFRIVNAHE